jgi:hypothetical protein
MTRTYTITPEIVDIDVCYGDWDSHISKDVWYLEVFNGGIFVDGVGFYSEADAKHHGDKFVSTGCIAGELI